MPPSPMPNQKRTLAALALITCALTPGIALARPIDDPTLPPRATRDQAAADLPTPIVTRNTPSGTSTADTLALVLSGAALLVAVGGVGLSVRRRQPPPHPAGRPRDSSTLNASSR